MVLRRGGVTLTVAGRTDAGVHAWSQVASYAGAPAPVRSLNALLPDDVAAIECVAAAPGFSARHDATSRAYCYRVLTRCARSPHESGRALHWPHRLDPDLLHACARSLVGSHDFTAWTPTETGHTRFVRNVFAAQWRELGSEALEFWIEADAFLRHMNRILVGTMLEVAGGRRSVAEFSALLEGGPRAAAGRTAPPDGLYLAGVGYDGQRVIAT
ncbi:MAG: tRNA pseudouridine synthase A [Solirubrobacteraceae bacterium]